MHDLAPGSLLVLRLPSALVSATTTVLAALVAREVGGRERAQLIAAICTATSGFALAVGHIVSTTTPDMLSTTAFLLLVIRALARRSGASLLAAGLVVGVGFEAKPQVGVVAVVAALAVAAVGPRWPLRSAWTAAGALAAVLLAAPFLVWQQRHGWPQVTVAGNVAGSAEGGRVGFIPFQLVMVSPVLAPVWVAALLAPFRRPSLRWLRFLPLTYVGLALAYLVGDGKAYYLASLYPVLLGIGALPTADWTERRRLNTGLLTSAVALSVAISCVYSGHNGFSEWGEPAATDTHALLIGYGGPSDAAPDFRGCRRLATIDDGVGLDNDEQGLPVLLCRASAPWATLWPKLVHYD